MLRIADLIGAIPSITGKIELVYEGEQEGSNNIAHNLIGKAIRSQFINYFPNPLEIKKVKNTPNPYKPITGWFEKGNMIDLLHNLKGDEYKKTLSSVPGLKELIDTFQKDKSEEEKLFLMEFALYGLAEYSMLSKHELETGAQFKDLLSAMFSMPTMEDEDLDEEK
jgi:magnesium chelatase subunit I